MIGSEIIAMHDSDFVETAERPGNVPVASAIFSQPFCEPSFRGETDLVRTEVVKELPRRRGQFPAIFSQPNSETRRNPQIRPSGQQSCGDVRTQRGFPPSKGGL
jgi:hypothetical protein